MVERNKKQISPLVMFIDNQNKISVVKRIPVINDWLLVTKIILAKMNSYITIFKSWPVIVMSSGFLTITYD